jgi:hypothetical protein
MGFFQFGFNASAQSLFSLLPAPPGQTRFRGNPNPQSPNGASFPTKNENFLNEFIGHEAPDL